METSIITAEGPRKPHGIAKEAIGLAFGRDEEDPEFHRAVGMINALSRQDLLGLSKLAIAQRNTDGIDQLPREDRDRIVFAEDFLVSQLSEAERGEAYGPKL